VHPDKLGRQVRLVLVEADGALQREQDTQHGQRALDDRPGVAASRQPPDRDRREAEHERDLAMAMDHEVHRPAPVEAQPVDLLAGRAARVRPGGGRGRAGEDRQRPPRDEPAQ
jgi:hypothetical protein